MAVHVSIYSLYLSLDPSNTAVGCCLRENLVIFTKLSSFCRLQHPG